MMHTIAQFLAGHFLAALMLSVGLRTETAIVREVFKHSRIVLWALAIVWIAVPLLTLILLHLIAPTPFVAATLMTLAICPGIPLVLGKSKRAQGHYRASLLILLTTALTAIFMVPLWSAILGRFTSYHLSFGLYDVAKVLLPTVFIPYTIGRIIQELSPRVAKPLAVIAQALFITGLVIIVAVVLSKRLLGIRQLEGREVIDALLIPMCAALLGAIAARRVTLGEQVSLTYACALGNPALALAVMAHSYTEKAVSIVLSFILLRAVALIPFSLWFKHRRRDEATGGPPTRPPYPCSRHLINLGKDRHA